MARVKVLYEAGVGKMISGVGETRWYRGRFRPYCESSKGVFLQQIMPPDRKPRIKEIFAKGEKERWESMKNFRREA